MECTIDTESWELQGKLRGDFGGDVWWTLGHGEMDEAEARDLYKHRMKRRRDGRNDPYVAYRIVHTETTRTVIQLNTPTPSEITPSTT